MILRLPLLLLWAAIATFVVVGCSQGGSDSRAADGGLEPVSVTVFTDEVELFMEYPRLIRGHEARFLAHVTVLATGQPVRSGSVTLEATGQADPSFAQIYRTGRCHRAGTSHRR